MNLIYIAVLLVFIGLIFLLWQLIKLKQDHQAALNLIQDQTQRINNQETNLKKTLEIMQDLVKKMHTQQEALDHTSNKLSQVELQNVELIKVIQQSIQR